MSCAYLREQVDYWRSRALRAEKRELIYAAHAGRLQERVQVLRALLDVAIDPAEEPGDPPDPHRRDT